MSANTKIEWADHTFNPWIGCTQISPGCDGCYAKAWDQRFAGSVNATHLQRPKELRSHLALAGLRLRALALTKDGTPAHPLMLPYSCKPIHLNGDPA